MSTTKTHATPCRSELAREKRPGRAVTQKTRFIVNDFREQARSYRVWFA